MNDIADREPELLQLRKKLERLTDRLDQLESTTALLGVERKKQTQMDLQRVLLEVPAFQDLQALLRRLISQDFSNPASLTYSSSSREQARSLEVVAEEALGLLDAARLLIVTKQDDGSLLQELIEALSADARQLSGPIGAALMAFAISSQLCRRSQLPEWELVERWTLEASSLVVRLLLRPAQGNPAAVLGPLSWLLERLNRSLFLADLACSHKRLDFPQLQPVVSVLAESIRLESTNLLLALHLSVRPSDRRGSSPPIKTWCSVYEANWSLLRRAKCTLLAHMAAPCARDGNVELSFSLQLAYRQGGWAPFLFWKDKKKEPKWNYRLTTARNKVPFTDYFPALRAFEAFMASCCLADLRAIVKKLPALEEPSVLK